MKRLLGLLAAVLGWPGCAVAIFGASTADPARDLSGDQQTANYFRAETRSLAERCLADVRSREDWEAQRGKLRQELFEMLSLEPLPGRSDLKPVVTGKIDHEDFTVEKLHYQSMPGLYVTANLYLPKSLPKPAPAILYVCGHALVATNGVSYGNKTAYQHHGIWFARNGYVCLMIDTIQLGEIQGVHHGTYREGLWWWNSRGYTPAGVEAWNSIRALDYLQSRPEVDGQRLGVTGRSGGGAYSWWLAALDDRIQVAAPVAGITDLQNHVVDGVVEGHCDCMFVVNTYRWDYASVAALVAPRPLLICNSDKDSIFPLDGVLRVHAKVAAIYKLYGAADRLGLLITEGPHKDSQDLQLPAFRWFNRHLKREDPIIEMAATRLFTPAQLRVFAELPADERTSKIHDSFVPLAPVPKPPETLSQWETQREGWKRELSEKVFRGWPHEPPPLNTSIAASETNGNRKLTVYEFTSEHDIRLRAYVLETVTEAMSPGNSRRPMARMRVLDHPAWRTWIQTAGAVFPDALRVEFNVLGTNSASLAANFATTLSEGAEICFAPRGVGLSAWTGDPGRQVHLRRRYMLLGQTLDGQRVWDIRRALQVLRATAAEPGRILTLESRGAMAVDVLYAALFEPDVGSLDLAELPTTHQDGPDFLNVLRVLDIPQAMAMVMERSQVRLTDFTAEAWAYPKVVRANLGWPVDRLQGPAR